MDPVTILPPGSYDLETTAAMNELIATDVGHDAVPQVTTGIPAIPDLTTQSSTVPEITIEPDPVPVVKEVNRTPYSSPMKADEFDYDMETAFMPSGTVSQVDDQLANLPKNSMSDTQSGREWSAVIGASKQTNVYSEGLVKTVMAEGATFSQSVESDQGKLTAGVVNFKAQEGTKFTGEKARLRARQALKLGSIFSVPLYHSGFWVRLKSPSEGDLLELYRQITAERITLGRATYGLLFTNNTSYASRALLDFSEEHIYDMSLDLKDGDDVRKYIKTLDLPVLFWALACSVWSNGFQYMRACIANPDKCTHVVKEKLDLTKLQFTNTSALTKRQINHMSKRQRATVDVQSLERYCEEFIVGQKRNIKITDDATITVKIPSALEHIDAGYRWINAIEENYGRALIQDENKRDNYLISQGKATVMRQYAHFVDSININGEVYDDLETIEGILNDMSANDAVRDKFLQEVSNYIDDSVVSLIAIPTYTCPSCGGKQKPGKEHKQHPDLIPVDVNNTFFTLAVQKIKRIEAR